MFIMICLQKDNPQIIMDSATQWSLFDIFFINSTGALISRMDKGTNH